MKKEYCETVGNGGGVEITKRNRRLPTAHELLTDPNWINIGFCGRHKEKAIYLHKHTRTIVTMDLFSDGRGIKIRNRLPKDAGLFFV